ncbi:UDP-N-acetylmuramate dehydrogenase [Shewanella maritima]|uniref:UDP-N-acetylenolpyruvoylglucosamine reductase n=1 Tax=Shewanella maritima TaxID=2520507 RepID=A0A411PIE4_9GAMM|nr:UDP-N-acetylmuramate dehydrogenase [Shewanella maritima]QBF83172.1 UDP-N-acetylmuramate dehydrogenase [Shewanella maritima]
MPVSLQQYNTLGLAQSCQALEVIESKSQLVTACQQLKVNNTPMLILGGGSNVILTADFAGTCLQMNSKGIEVHQVDGGVELMVQAGEDWHQLVEFCLAHGYYGLENLALIPGTVGAAPIQNIGAYGLELSQFCRSVEYLDLESLTFKTLNNSQCEFAYRDSVFKHQLKEKAIISAVTLFIPNDWQPNLSYGPLTHLIGTDVSAKQVFDCVCATRMSKLPDPKVLGNVGSFFKNPIIDGQQFAELKQRFDGIVGYEQDNGSVKVAAGWLIDNAGLKGYQQGAVGVHHQQALVLVNLGGANGADIRALAHYVVEVVERKFAIRLHAEPRVFGEQGEISL